MFSLTLVPAHFSNVTVLLHKTSNVLMKFLLFYLTYFLSVENL